MLVTEEETLVHAFKIMLDSEMFGTGVVLAYCQDTSQIPYPEDIVLNKMVLYKTNGEYFVLNEIESPEAIMAFVFKHSMSLVNTLTDENFYQSF